VIWRRMLRARTRTPNPELRIVAASTSGGDVMLVILLLIVLASKGVESADPEQEYEHKQQSKRWQRVDC
jgi:hypothetical protein